MASSTALRFSPVDLFTDSLLADYDAEANRDRLNKAVASLPEEQMPVYVEGTQAIEEAAIDARVDIARSSMNANSARAYFRNAVRAARAKVRM